MAAAAQRSSDTTTTTTSRPAAAAAASSSSRQEQVQKRRLVLVAGERKARMTGLLTLLLNNAREPWVQAFASECMLDVSDGPRLAASMATPQARQALRSQPLFFSFEEWALICRPSKVVLESSKDAVKVGLASLGGGEATPPALDPVELRKPHQPRPAASLQNWKYCLGCHRAGQALKRCGGCRAAYFCGAECQQKAWKRAHKHVCAAWAAPKDLETADHASIASHHPLDGARVVTLAHTAMALSGSGSGSDSAPPPASAPAQVVYLPGDDPAYPGGLRLGTRML